MQTRQMLTGILTGLAVAAGGPITHAATLAEEPAANPYQAIPGRNLFHLNPPPAVQEQAALKPPTPKVFLTGISTLGNTKRALLKTAPVAKPGEAPKERSYMLTEGERQDDLEVVAIDEKEGAVKVNYAGDQFSVNFKDNAVASAAPTAPPPGAPGVPGMPAVNRVPMPGTMAPGFRPGVPAVPVAPPPTPLASQPLPGAAGGVGAGSMAAVSGPYEAVGLTPEQVAVMTELAREKAKSDPEMPPLPPTILTEELTAAQQEAAAAANARNAGRGPGQPPLPGSF